MGYTHYWKFEKVVLKKDYAKALRACRKIIRNSPVPLANRDGKGKPSLRNGFNFNGVGDDGYENFGMATQVDDQSYFCKTAQKPYDVVVTACLIVLQHYLGEYVSVRSDGDPHEWEDGKALANKILNKEFSIPQDVIDTVGCYGWYAKQYRKEHPEYNYTPLDISHPNHKNERIPEYSKG